MIKLGFMRAGRWPAGVKVAGRHVSMYNIERFRVRSVWKFFSELRAFHKTTPLIPGEAVFVGKDEAALLIDMLDSGEFRARYNDRMGSETISTLHRMMQCVITYGYPCQARFEE